MSEQNNEKVLYLGVFIKTVGFVSLLILLGSYFAFFYLRASLACFCMLRLLFYDLLKFRLPVGSMQLGIVNNTTPPSNLESKKIISNEYVLQNLGKLGLITKVYENNEPESRISNAEANNYLRQVLKL